MTGPIVVGVDGSEEASEAVRWASAEAVRRRLPLRLVHAYVVPASGLRALFADAERVAEAAGEQGRQWLAEAERVAGVPAETVLVRSRTAAALIRESCDAAMVVVGARGRGGFSGLRAGSTALAVSAHGACPVVVVRVADRSSGPVVVGVDGSPAGEAAIGFAFAEASTRGAPLVAVHASDEPLVDSPYGPPRVTFDRDVLAAEGERLLAQRLAGWQEEHPDVPVERVVVHDTPVRALLDLAPRAQLVVVGSHGHGGFTGMLLGSTGQALVNHAPCPLAIVRPADGSAGPAR